MEKINEAVKKS